MWEILVRLWQALIDNSGAVVAVFTIVLAVTTIIYVTVSWKLLKQSRNAFFADMVLRVMEIYRSATKEMVKKGETDSSMLEGWTEGLSKAFIEVDKKFGTALLKVFMVGMNAARKWWSEAVKKREGEMKELKGEMKKLEKELKKN